MLLDTHALLWWQAASPLLARSALRRIHAADRVYVSPVSCWEVGMLAAKGRVRLDRPTAVWVRDLLSQPDVAVAELTPGVAVAAAELPEFHGDPADRFLYATAGRLNLPLLSRDRVLSAYAAVHGDVAVVW